MTPSRPITCRSSSSSAAIRSWSTEVPEKPAELPERPLVAVKPGADVPAGVKPGIENQESRRSARIGGVPGNFKPYHPSQIGAFEQGFSVVGLIETANFDSHDWLLSEKTYRTEVSG